MADDAEAPEPPLPEMAPARPPDYNAIRNYSFDDLLMHQTPDKKLTIFNKAGTSMMRSSSGVGLSGEAVRTLEFKAPSGTLPAPRSVQRAKKVKSAELLRNSRRSGPELTKWPGLDPGKFWASKQCAVDANHMRFNAARDSTLKRHLYEDPEVYSYGALHPQIVPHIRADINKMHPVDKIDMHHPKSLVMGEKAKGETVAPWDGTRKKITGATLWRTSTSNV